MVKKEDLKIMNDDLGKKPLVSVVLPVYNRPGVIYTINSVLEQTYSYFELLIIDNASTDDTVNVIKNICDDRIKLYVNEENKGQTYSLNKGLHLATGKYIARIDSDDLMLPTRLEKQVNYMEANPNCSICGSNVQIIDDNDLLIEEYVYPDTDEDIRVLASIYCPFAHPAVMLRSEYLRQNNIKYDLNYRMAEDYDMWIRMLRYGKGYNIQEYLTKYRKGRYNDSVKYHTQMKKEGNLVRQHIADTFKLQNCSKNEYKSLLKMAEKPNKNCFEILKTLFSWNRYLHRTSCKKSNYEIIKSRLTIFMCESCFEDNERASVQFVYSTLRLLKKLIKR